MPNPIFVAASDLVVYDGAGKRCKLDNASVAFAFEGGANPSPDDCVKCTGADGELGDLMVSQAYPSVRITVSKSGYKTVTVRSNITLGNPNVGKLTLLSVNLLT